MSNVGNVAHKEDLIDIIFEHTAQPVGWHKGAKVTNMDIFVDSGTTVIDAHPWWIERMEQFFTSGQCIIQVNRLNRGVSHELISPLKCIFICLNVLEVVAQTGDARETCLLLWHYGHANTFAEG